MHFATLGEVTTKECGYPWPQVVVGYDCMPEPGLELNVTNTSGATELQLDLFFPLVGPAARNHPRAQYQRQKNEHVFSYGAQCKFFADVCSVLWVIFGISAVFWLCWQLACGRCAKV